MDKVHVRPLGANLGYRFLVIMMTKTAILIPSWISNRAPGDRRRLLPNSTHYSYSYPAYTETVSLLRENVNLLAHFELIGFNTYRDYGTLEGLPPSVLKTLLSFVGLILSCWWLVGCKKVW